MMAERRGVEPRCACAQPSLSKRAHSRSANAPNWWTGRELNPQPSVCGTDVLPVELRGPKNIAATRGNLSTPISPEEGKSSGPLQSGWGEGNRTPDLMRPRHAPCHSATPQWGRGQDSNLQPTSYEDAALPIELPRRLFSCWRRVQESNLHVWEDAGFRDRGDANSATTLRTRRHPYRDVDDAGVGVAAVLVTRTRGSVTRSGWPGWNRTSDRPVYVTSPPPLSFRPSCRDGSRTRDLRGMSPTLYRCATLRAPA